MNNAFEFSRTLVSAGVERKAADAIAEVVVTHFDENAATKSDIAELKAATKSDIAELKAATKSDIAELRAELKIDIAELRAEIRAVAAEGKERDKVMMVMLTGVSIGLIVLLVAQFFIAK